MIEEFKNLSQDEVETMYKVPVLVSILIAGADNEIDKSEIRQAVTLSKIKQSKAREGLIDYYREAGKDFEDKMKVMIQQYPVNAKERNPMIISELERVNHILPKVDRKFAIEFYESIKDMAKKIAEASGGLLGYMAVGYEESKLIGLQMIKDPGV
ncbi:hypothetical protein C900_03427 [Fulvivirga imtechensis AK7]|uniref:Co-chaperone DjlA N-terminal domain-containing protein n=1 Tax=Fulvivirga imtechensis AK7 TaxID=1237149 RepID=L8JTI8_9BACT|nr:hypothetical protein [Fulvivirga imtechensis]ELR70819.1 hypothetical protein C900_03427 [Fulvivirga imtechensis AK7]